MDGCVDGCVDGWVDGWVLSLHEPACGQCLAQRGSSSDWPLSVPGQEAACAITVWQAQHRTLFYTQLLFHFASKLEDHQGCNQFKDQGKCSVSIYFRSYSSELTWCWFTD